MHVLIEARELESNSLQNDAVSGPDGAEPDAVGPSDRAVCGCQKLHTASLSIFHQSVA